jgi:spore maturation protein SpmB
MPSPTDEEAHQLSYLQKHIANIISLLAEPVEGQGDDSLVCAKLFLCLYQMDRKFYVVMQYYGKWKRTNISC